jgi:hypothetical protein
MTLPTVRWVWVVTAAFITTIIAASTAATTFTTTTGAVLGASGLARRPSSRRSSTSPRSGNAGAPARSLPRLLPAQRLDLDETGAVNIVGGRRHAEEQPA